MTRTEIHTTNPGDLQEDDLVTLERGVPGGAGWSSTIRLVTHGGNSYYEATIEQIQSSGYRITRVKRAGLTEVSAGDSND